MQEQVEYVQHFAERTWNIVEALEKEETNESEEFRRKRMST